MRALRSGKVRDAGKSIREAMVCLKFPLHGHTGDHRSVPRINIKELLLDLDRYITMVLVETLDCIIILSQFVCALVKGIGPLRL